MRQWLKRNASAVVGAFLSVLAVCVSSYLAKAKLNPPVGTYIALMGLTAAIVSFFRVKKTEKFAWICFMTVLMVAEIRNLYVADADQLAKFTKVSDALDATKRGLDAAAEGIHATSVAIKTDTEASQKQFEENVKTITGGSSFSIVWAPLMPISPNTFSLMMSIHGRYDLQDVQVEVVKLPEPGFGTKEWMEHTLAGTNPNMKSVTIGNVSHKSGKIIPISVTASDDGTITEYSINVFARNRTTHESLRIMKNLKTGEWESSFKVIDGDSHKTLQQSKPEWRSFRMLPPR